MEVILKMVGPSGAGSSNDPRLVLIQEIRSLNRFMAGEIGKWIQYLDVVIGKLSKKYNKGEVLKTSQRLPGRKYKQVFESLSHINTQELKTIFVALKKSLDDEETKLSAIFKEVEIAPSSVSTGLFNSIVEHNEKQITNFNDLNRYWKSFFSGLDNVVGALVKSIEETSKEFVAKYDIFVKHLESKEPSVEYIFHSLAELIDIMILIETDKVNKEKIISKFNSLDATDFYNNYKNAKKTINAKFKDFEKLKDKSFDAIEHSDKYSDKKEKIDEFLLYTLKILFEGKNNITDKLDDIFDDINNTPNNPSGTNKSYLSSQERQKLNSSFRQLYTRFSGNAGFKMPSDPNNANDIKQALITFLDTLFNGESSIKKAGWKCVQFSKVCKTKSPSTESQARNAAGNPWETLLKTTKDNYSKIIAGDEAHVTEFFNNLNAVIDINWFSTL